MYKLNKNVFITASYRVHNCVYVYWKEGNNNIIYFTADKNTLHSDYNNKIS